MQWKREQQCAQRHNHRARPDCLSCILVHSTYCVVLDRKSSASFSCWADNVSASFAS